VLFPLFIASILGGELGAEFLRRLTFGSIP